MPAPSTTSETSTEAARRPLSLTRRLIFAAVLSLLVLAVVLAALESVLRLAGYGYSARFHRTVRLHDGTEIVRENRWCTAPFFSPELVRRPQPMRLPAKKRPGTVRLFVLGSSAAMGDPEASFSIARVLERMLVAAYPETRFEVVNAGITAVNSHVVRGIAWDCAALEPDLFLVYEGNNEVIGPFGPAGVFTPFLRSEAAVRAAVAMKSTRSGQWIAALARAAAGRGAGGAPEWGGMEMFLEQRIAWGDARLHAVRAQFRANLRAIAEAGHAAGATTILATVACNARTFAPFASLHRADLEESDLRRWEQLVAQAAAALAAGHEDQAEQAYRAALALDDQYAEIHYQLGRLALRRGLDASAREHLRRALDCDALRFRTDSALNDVIRSMAASSEAGPLKVRVVDAAMALDAASPHGLCGDEFFYEHVHLTLRGTYELARLLMPAIGEELHRRGLVGAIRTDDVLSYDDVRVRLGYTAYEQGMIAVEMLSRLMRPPFTAQADHGGRVHVWQRRADAAQALLDRGDATASLRAAMELAWAASPEDWVLARNYGMMLVARGAADDAVPWLERSLQWIDDDVDALVAMAVAQRALGRQAEAETLLNRVRQLEPRHPAVRTAPPTGPE